MPGGAVKTLTRPLLEKVCADVLRDMRLPVVGLAPAHVRVRSVGRVKVAEKPGSILFPNYKIGNANTCGDFLGVSFFKNKMLSCGLHTSACGVTLRHGGRRG